MLFLQMLLVLIGGCYLVLGWNISDSMMTMDKEELKSRSGKFITFESDDENISVDLEFGIPFLKIPVKKSLDTAHVALANLNVGALVLTGLVIFVSTTILPGILLFFKHKFMATAQYDKFNTGYSQSSYRNEDDDLTSIWRVLTNLDNFLIENNIDTVSCTQRMICSAVQVLQQRVSEGNATSEDKILEGLASSKWIQNILPSTELREALTDGLENVDCVEKYKTCLLSEKTLGNLFSKLTNVLGRR